jgi:hypothetical protein
MNAGVGPALTRDVLVANSRTQRLLPLREYLLWSWLISSLLGRISRRRLTVVVRFRFRAW